MTSSSPEREVSTRLKHRLLHHGARIPPHEEAAVAAAGKRPLRVRSGSCGGLDATLPGGVPVNIPVREPFAGSSPFEVRRSAGGFVIARADGGPGDGTPLELTPEPAFHTAERDGRPLSRIGQLCFDRLGVGLTNLCTFWRGDARRCRFCSIGLNLPTEQRTKGVEDVLAVVDAAYGDPVQPARHLLLGGGTPPGDDAGGRLMAEIARAVRDRWPDRPIYAMLTPPADLGVLDEMAASGITEVGMNMELFDPAAAQRHMPGKHREIGRERYLAALERAVAIFGPIHTRSILIAGLEAPASTLRGVEVLAERGVMPILSPFRPLRGTALEHHPRPAPEQLDALAAEGAAIAARSGIPLGPTCLSCQGNTITPPTDPAYRRY